MRRKSRFSGCKGAHDELIAIAEKLTAPTVFAFRGKEFIEYDNLYDVGMTGLLGFSSGYHAIMDSEVFLMLGTDFPYSQFYPENATVIQVDIRGEQIGRRTHVEIGLIGDVKALCKLSSHCLSIKPIAATWTKPSRTTSRREKI